MRKGLRTLTTVTALTILAAPAAAHAESSYGDPLRILHQPTSVIGASSGPDGLALRLFHVEADERDSVRYQDAQGRWHRFVVPGAAQTVRLAQLGDGGRPGGVGRGQSVVVRTWDRAGTLAPARAVLTDAVTTWSSDFESPGWGLAYDGEGTVALASAARGVGRDRHGPRPGRRLRATAAARDLDRPERPGRLPRRRVRPLARGLARSGWRGQCALGQSRRGARCRPRTRDRPRDPCRARDHVRGGGGRPPPRGPVAAHQ